jgi:hypothetical protein
MQGVAEDAEAAVDVDDDWVVRLVEVFGNDESSFDVMRVDSFVPDLLVPSTAM